MKTITKIITVLAIAITVCLPRQAKAQSGDSCVNARTVRGTFLFMQTLHDQWFSFVSANDTLDITLTNKNYGASDIIHKIIVWRAPCSSLALVGSDTITATNDSVLTLSLTGLSVDSLYYFQIVKGDNTHTIQFVSKMDFKNASYPGLICADDEDYCDITTDGDFEYYDASFNNGAGNFTGLTGLNQLHLACPWDKPTDGTSDYFNLNGHLGLLGGSMSWQDQALIPHNTYGAQNSVNSDGTSGGNGYAGFHAYSYYSSVSYYPNTHDYISEPLACKMISGINYDVSFMVSLSDYSHYATNHIGMYLSTDNPSGANYTTSTDATYSVHLGQLQYTAGPTDVVPQIQEGDYGLTTSGNVGFINTGCTGNDLSDLDGWAKISKIYIASGNEAFLTIGDFGNTTTGTDLNINYTHWGDDSFVAPDPYYQTNFSNKFAYYYVDQVSIKPKAPVLVFSGENPPPCMFTTGTVLAFSFDNYSSAAGVTYSVDLANSGDYSLFTNSFPFTPGAGSFTLTWAGSAPPDHEITIIITMNICRCAVSGQYTILPCCQNADASLQGSPIINIGTEGNSMDGGGTSTVHIAKASQLLSNCGTGLPMPANWAGTGLTPTITGKTFSINGTFTVDVDLDLEECDISMGHDAKIVVLGNPGAARLDVNNSHLHSCTLMWNGIEVDGDNGGSNKGEIHTSLSIIEDADSAIVSINAARYGINDCIFNKNYYGLVVNGKDVSSAYTLDNYSVTNTVFTCRDIYPSYRTFVPTAISSEVSAFISYEYGTGNYPGHYCGSSGGGGYTSLYPFTSDCKFTNLLPPLDTKRSFTGIEVRNVINSSPIVLGDQSYEGSRNTFDYLDYGIRALKSNALVYNNIFINIYNIDKKPTYDCAGLFAWDWVKPGNPTYKLTVGDDPTGCTVFAPNMFYNCTNGVYSREYNNFINYNYMDNIIHDGVLVDRGVSMTNDIRKNNMYAMNYGIVTQGRVDGSSLIQDNIIYVTAQVDPSVFPPAIWSFGIGSFDNYYHSASMTIDENYIYLDGVVSGGHGTRPAYGIYAQATNDVYNITNNQIHFEDPASYSNVTPSTGIDLEGDDGGTGTGIVQYNTIWDDTGVSSTTKHGTNDDLYGIMVANSTGTQVFNNSARYMGSGIAAVGSCTGSLFGCNYLESANDGFMFYSAVIPNQIGTAGTGNCWAISCTEGVSTSAPYDIDGTVSGGNVIWNYQVTPPIYNPASSGTASNQFTFTSGATANACSGIGSNHSPVAMVSAVNKREMMLGKIVRGENVYDTLSSQFLIKDTVYAFKVLSQYDTLMHLNTTDDTTYQHFYSYTQNRNTGKFQEVQHLIDTINGNLATASSINNGINTTCTIEENRKTINTLRLTKLSFERDTTNGVGVQYKFSPSEVNQLRSIAYQKPLLGGNAVYDARIMLWTEVQDTFSVALFRAPIHKTELKKQSNFKLYPNPNTGTMTLDYNIEGTDLALFCIYDIAGRLIKQQTLNSQNNTMLIDAQELKGGVYYYLIKQNNVNLKTEKLVIVK